MAYFWVCLHCNADMEGIYMKDVKIIILEVQEKLASNGKTYWRFKTSSDEGVKWYTCFDAKVSAFLKGVVGKDKVVDAKIEDNLIKWTEFVSHGAPVQEINMTKEEVKAGFME